MLPGGRGLLLHDEPLLVEAVQPHASEGGGRHPGEAGEGGGPVHDVEEALLDPAPVTRRQQRRVDEGDGPCAALPQGALCPPVDKYQLPLKRAKIYLRVTSDEKRHCSETLPGENKKIFEAPDFRFTSDKNESCGQRS